MKFAITTILLACMCLPAAAQYPTDTIRDVPTDSTTTDDGNVQYHPEYKKLLDDLEQMDKELQGADDDSAAFARQRYQAAAARLTAYIDSGKPTIVAVHEPTGNFTTPPEPTPNASPSVTPGSNSTSGPRRTTVPECYVSFDFYERFDAEGLEFTGQNTVDVDSGEYALQWQGNSFSVQQTVTVVSENITGGWERRNVSISGRMSATGDSLETITFELEEVGEWEVGQVSMDGFRVTLVDLPLRQVNQAGVFDVYEFELRGGNAIQSQVQSFTKLSSDNGETTGMLRLNVSGDEPVMMNARREPRIYVKVMKSKL